MGFRDDLVRELNPDHAPQGIDVFELDAQGQAVNQAVRGGRHQFACRPG